LISLMGLVSSAGMAFADMEVHGFSEGRIGMRTRNDPYEDQPSLEEFRVQFNVTDYLEELTFQFRGDLLYDGQANDLEKVDLLTGDGFFDLRELNVLFTPVDWADVKLGRQILTWGTGDLLFINDMFPKDWISFFLGRDEEYLKAPSDALFISFFPSFGNIDLAYMPHFCADRYIGGRRVSYWNPLLQHIAGQNAVADVNERNDWFSEDELAIRFYRDINGYETALYFYSGYWKSPVGYDPASMNSFSPALNVYGASVRGMLGKNIVNAEVGYYDSRKDRNGNNPFIPNSEVRFLVGCEREVARDFTAAVQYYLEYMLDFDDYLVSLQTTDTARDEARHVLTLRLTRMLMDQNLILGLFIYYSPSDSDAYLRPIVTYKLDDHWMLTANGNFFFGEEDYTFFGQFRRNNNINFGIRYSY